ncbi:MAG: hypothetical protein K6E62_13040 [Lachnospiraceae bacterium]|nr:hypothetical protein [Lachnospiraceae bacterium]
MKSKTSFFNKTVFFKNIRRFWLLPAIFLFGYIWAMPVTIYFGFRINPSSYAGYRVQSLFTDLENSILCGYLILSLFYAIGAGLLTALNVFGYMHRNASVNFFHSLPSDRKQLFFTNLLSGFAMIAVPILITDIISLFVCASIGFNAVKALGIWLLASLIMAAFFYMFAVVCNMLSGQGWFAGTIYVIFLVYVLGINVLCVTVISLINVGCSVDYFLPDGIFGIVSPVTFFMNKILIYDSHRPYYQAGEILKMLLPELVTGAVCAVVFALIAYFLYKYRQSESAGDTVAFGFAKPIFRWGFAFSFSLLLTCIMLATVRPGYTASKFVMIVFIVIFGVLGFIIAQMLIRKSVHIFKLAKNQEDIDASQNDKIKAKKLVYRFKYETVCFAVAAFLLSLIVCFFAAKQNNYVPDQNDIRSISVICGHFDMKGALVYDKNVINEMLSVHHDIVDEMDKVAKATNEGWSYTDPYIEENTYFRIVYYMSDNTSIERTYRLPPDTKAYQHLQDTMKRKDLIVGLKFGGASASDIGSAYLLEDLDQETAACSDKDSQKLYEAFLEDVKDGNISYDDLFIDGYLYQIFQKTETYDENGNPIPADGAFSREIPFELINIDFSNPEERYVIAFDYRLSDSYKYFCVRLSEKCVHMLDVMKDCDWFI